MTTTAATYNLAILTAPGIHTTDNLGAKLSSVMPSASGIWLEAAALAVYIRGASAPISAKTNAFRVMLTANGGLDGEKGSEQYITDYLSSSYGSLNSNIAGLKARVNNATGKLIPFTFRQMLKSLGYEAMWLLALTSSAPTTTAYLMAGYAVDKSFSTWMQVMGVDPAASQAIAVAVDARCTQLGGSLVKIAQQHPAFTQVSAILSGAATPAKSTASDDDNTTPATQGATPMTTANNAAAPAIVINDGVKPIINSVLQTSGVTLTIDDLVGAVSERDALQTRLDAAERMAADTIATLQRQVRDAKSAAPATLTVAASGALPSGKYEMVEVGKVFPQLAKVALQVPMWTWDAPHPHVPEVIEKYIFRTEPLLRAVRCIAQGENLWLQGHTGSGKTTFVEQIAAHLGWPMMRVALDSSIDRAELVGSWKLIPDGKGGTSTEFLPGVIERAIAHNYILLLDEVDCGRPDALYTLQPVFERKGMLLLEDGARTVPFAPLTRIVATGNTCGNGDPSGVYPACRILSAATLDRFAEFIHVPYLTSEEEDGLLEAHTSLKPAMRKKIASFATEMRNAFVRGEMPVSYSPRRSIAFARAVEDFQGMVKGISEADAVNMALRGKLFEATPPEFRQRMTELAKAALGSGTDPSKNASI